jgi:lactate dehydrogenase-like 2-hydroxyacid dehydrogenase
VDRLRSISTWKPTRLTMIWTQQELADAWRDKVGAFTTGSERIDAALLAACPQLKIVRQHGRGLQQLRRGRHDRRTACRPPIRPMC